MTSSKLITIGFSTHRPETLPFAAEQMQRHQVILLEEPETPGFEQMLKDNLSIENYLHETDFEYPEFSRRSCELFQILYQNGKQLFQVDPFITQLNAIHDFFAAGGTPPDIEPNTTRGRVYNAERHYSAALLAYYERCLTAPFDEVVDLVKRFAREDARRGRLRDQMRAEAIVAIIPPYESVYVEAGLLHLSLLNQLAKELPAEYCIHPVYLMAPVVRQLNARRQALGPGDKLTLLYTYRPDYAHPRADQLAAQSLIYTKILIKEEMVGVENSFPHTRNEVESSALVQQLTYSDCEALYALIKNRTTKEAMEVVRAYFDR
jgi:hypothetical protein